MKINQWMNASAFPYGKKFETEQVPYHDFSIAFYEKLKNDF